MVKTPFGRKPGNKHAKIVKKLRHRRRVLATQAAREYKQFQNQPTDEIDTVSCEVLERQPELPYCRMYFNHLDADDELSFDEGRQKKNDGNEKPKVAENVTEERQLVPFKGRFVLNRGVSEAFVGNGMTATVGRSRTVSESCLQGAIPLPAPTPQPSNNNAPEEEHEGHEDDDRAQHPDEQTDQYLSMFFTPSIANLTSHHDDHHTDNNRSEDFTRLRNLFSSDSQHTRHGTIPETTLGLNTLFNNHTLRNITSCETSMGLNTLFHERSHHDFSKFKPGLPTILSETSLGLNSLFNNQSATTMGHDENNQKNHRQVHSSASTYGLNSLFGHGRDDDEPRCVSPTLKSHNCQCRTVGELPSMTNFSSTSLLGNLFGSEHAIHDGEEILSAKERKKALIAKDLAHYLNSDDERSHGRSTSLSTFVQQIEALFDKYRSALAEIESLRKEAAEWKPHREE